MSIRNFAFIHILVFIVLTIFSTNPWPFLMLSVAQLVYIPIALKLVMIKGDWFSNNYSYFAVPAYAAVILLQIASSKWDGVLAAIYLLFTLVIALYGLSRFFKRGFTNLEEFAIDMGLMYLAMGGGWFFAYIAGIDTGFSPLLTWLTAIHFHYSAFLLPIFIGFLGRLHTSRLYSIVSPILLISPIIVAIGITFSRWIELLSVVLYIFGLAGLIFIAWQTPFANRLQRWLIRISFASLAVTITFSLLYALGNGFGLTSITIDFMLRFHGVLNCIIFALFGLIGWSLAVPPPTFKAPHFPVSQLRGAKGIGELELTQNHQGLVDDMLVYELQYETISPIIVDFYENTIDYRLFASVKWRRWFKPFAFLYGFMSRQMQQINLPLSSRQVEMTGDIFTLHDELDGRDNVRVWTRKIDDDTAFVALYSQHKTDERTYMNIALPLPFSTMTGILELNQVGDNLQLTSKRINTCDSDAGIYLSFRKNELFKLPIEENFVVRETKDGGLSACHEMWLFSIPFLMIDYSIDKK